MSARRAAARGALAGASLAAASATGYVLQHRAVRKWAVGPEAVTAAGLELPADLVHHLVETDDGGHIHAVERGQGTAVVLVHGVTLGVDTWSPQLHALADAHRVIALGQRGHGRSVAGTGGYSLLRLADDLVAVLSDLDVRRAVLVGHSMGGMVALVGALRRSALLHRHVAGLVLLATSAGPLVALPGKAPGKVPGKVLGPPVVLALAAGAGRNLRASARRGRGLLPSEDLARWLARACFGSRPVAAQVELTRAMISAMSPAAMAELLVPLATFDIHRQLGAVDFPARVVVGSRDLLTPPRMARVMAGRIPGATLTTYPGCGHMVMLERSGELDALVRAFSSELG